MRYLRNAEIIGVLEDVKVVKENFGSIYFGFGDAFDQEPHSFTLKRFRNIYTSSDPYKPLFVLVPDQKISYVWPGDIKKYKDIKYGTSTKERIGEVTPGIVFHLPNGVGLYFCLTPAGLVLEEEGSLGI